MSAQRGRVLALAGSLRKASYNRRLLAVAVAAGEAQGARVDVLEPEALRVPLYDADLEAADGLPPEVQALRERIAAADGLLIASPEYNHSIPGVLKNAIDCASRPPEQPFRGKWAALLGASPGGFGAVRSLAALRQPLMALGVLVLPTLVTVSRAGDAFDEAGGLKDEGTQRQVERLVRDLLARL